MTFSPVPLVVKGDLWTAAQHNLYIRDNFPETEPGKVTAAGDIVYGTGLNTTSVLPFQANSLIKSGTSAPEYTAYGDPFGKIGHNLTVTALEWRNNPPGQKLIRSTAQAIPTSAITPINFTSAPYDPYSMFDPGVPSYMIIPYTWDFLCARFDAYMLFEAPNYSIQQLNVRITRSGTVYSVGPGQTVCGFVTGRNFRVNASFYYHVKGMDIVQLIAYQESGGNMNVHNTKFSMRLIR